MLEIGMDKLSGFLGPNLGDPRDVFLAFTKPAWFIVEVVVVVVFDNLV